MVAPELPTWQDCHELWSKKRRRQMREAELAGKAVPAKLQARVPPYDETMDMSGGGGGSSCSPLQKRILGDSSSKALKMEAGFMSREMSYHAPVGPTAMLDSPMETTTPPQPASRVNAGVRPMSISTSSNHSESRTPPEPEESQSQSIHNQLSGIAHALLTRQPVRVYQLMALHSDKEVDPMTYQLTDSLRMELKQAAGANSMKPHKLDPKQHVFHPQVSGDGWSGGEGGFDAHAVYEGDNAVSASGRSSLATEGVRNTLAALLNRYNHPAAAQSLHTG